MSCLMSYVGEHGIMEDMGIWIMIPTLDVDQVVPHSLEPDDY